MNLRAGFQLHSFFSILLVAFSALLFSLQLCPSQPVSTSGEPSASDTQRAVQARIAEQSEGRIKLVSFKQIVARPSELELNGQKTYEAEYVAEIEFTEPCTWASRFEGGPLTFTTSKLDGAKPTVEDKDVFVISERGERFKLRGHVIFVLTDKGWSLAGFGSSARPIRLSDELSNQCVTNLKQIGLAFLLWANDNNDRFPFNSSTNAGGTMEFCARANDGFDRNAALHFRVLSNELNTPKLLVCPADTTKQTAVNFPSLQPANVSYQVRSGTNVDETHPEEILACCPIHGHTLYVDGHVVEGRNK